MLEFIAELFIEILFKGILRGIWHYLKKGINALADIISPKKQASTF